MCFLKLPQRLGRRLARLARYGILRIIEETDRIRAFPPGPGKHNYIDET